MDRPDRNPSSAQKHAHVDWSAYPLGPHQVAAMRRPRTEASTRRLDNAKGLTIRGPLQKDGLSECETHHCCAIDSGGRERARWVSLRSTHPTAKAAPAVVAKSA